MTDPDMAATRYAQHADILRRAEAVVQQRTQYVTDAIIAREKAIQAALADGMTQSEIARVTGLSRQRVSSLLKGR